MNWATPIDHYCERLGPGFWAEPFNAATNFSFLLAAVYGLYEWRRSGRDAGLLALSLTAFAIAVGSFLFHTLATRWAALADVIPIGLFIALGFALALARILRLAWWISLSATLFFLVAAPFLAGILAPVLGSSAGYGPALLALWIVGLVAVVRQRQGGKLLLAAGAVLSVSLLFRMADLTFCRDFPLGTHGFWHLCNGLVLALVIGAVAAASAHLPGATRPVL